MTWIQTYGGGQFSLSQPDPADIRIESIAHALSLICRFNGHCREFYSVAEHLVRASTLVPRMFAFETLMHDAPEAVCQDITRPLKAMLGEAYAAIERPIEEVFAARFRLAYPWPREVHEADMLMLAIERRDILGDGPEWELPLPPIPDGLRIDRPWSPDLAESLFLDRFRELSTIRGVEW